jgi:hypothetical protein
MPDTRLPPSVGIKHPDRLFIDGQSGIGREGGPEGLLPYVELETVHLPRVPRNLRG